MESFDNSQMVKWGSRKNSNVELRKEVIADVSALGAR